MYFDPVEELKHSQKSFESLNSSYTATEEDIQNIRNFCEVQLLLKEENSKKNKSTKTLLQECKLYKNNLLLELEKNKKEILKLDANNYLQLCIRKRTNNITFEMIREVFQNIDESFFQNMDIENDREKDQEDEKDEKHQQKTLDNDTSFYIERILNELRLLTKAITKTIKITNKIPREFKNEKIWDATLDVKNTSFLFLKNNKTIKDIRALHSNEIKKKKNEVKEIKKSVEEYLQKANVNNQQVAYENTPYQLIRKVSIGKPRLKIDVIESCLQQTCESMEMQMKKRPKNMLQYFIKNKKKILESLEEKILEIPQEPKTSILLRKLKGDGLESVTDLGTDLESDGGEDSNEDNEDDNEDNEDNENN